MDCDATVEDLKRRLAGVTAALDGLRESDERFRTMASAIDDVFYLTDLDGGALVYLSPAFERIWGRSAAELIADLSLFERSIHPEDLPIVLAAKARQARGEPVDSEYRILRPDGEVRWIHDRCFPVDPGPAGERRSAGIAADITAAKDIEAGLSSLQDRQRLLLAELQHRVRNILTVVRSVFARTVETGGSIEEIADHFRGRLDSLARTQLVATRSSGGAVDLENLIRDELLSAGISDGVTLRIEGPDVPLTATAAETLGLAIHELTTNALKYGALKTPAGTLQIIWHVNLDYRGSRQLVLKWLEEGVPAIAVKPARRGFGTELIEEALPYRLGAETQLEFKGGGVRCVISMPLPDPGTAADEVWKE